MSVKTVDDLLKEYKGVAMEYKNLPLSAKNAINVFYVEEYEIEINDDDTFIYVEIPTQALCDAILSPVDMKFKTFQEYHDWYVSGGDIPNHTEATYAVIIAEDEEDIIFDGWHRFHRYVDIGIKTIPCVLKVN